MIRRREALFGAVGLIGAAGAVCEVGAAPRRPLVIAHRGASGERPEHTMAAYRLAIEQGADFVEPDLVMTRDGHLICRHENELSSTTDIAMRGEFRDRRATKRVEGVEQQGWFAEDFTLEELRALKCKERLPLLRPASAAYDGQDAIPTLDEVLELARSESERLDRDIGVYPEMKHPSHFAQIGLSMPDVLRARLDANGMNRRSAPIIVQCFEVQALRSLRLQGVRTRLAFLIAAEGGPFDQTLAGRPRAYAEYLAGDLSDVSDFADGLNVDKSLVAPKMEDGRVVASTDIVTRAHAARLFVHAWTFRAENQFLPEDLRRGDPAHLDYHRQHGDFATEVRSFAEVGVDGIFTDFPARAIEALLEP
jgi:glycerophosphoryl diester phosphodiesterase